MTPTPPSSIVYTIGLGLSHAERAKVHGHTFYNSISGGVAMPSAPSCDKYLAAHIKNVAARQTFIGTPFEFFVIYDSISYAVCAY